MQSQLRAFISDTKEHRICKAIDEIFFLHPTGTRPVLLKAVYMLQMQHQGVVVISTLELSDIIGYGYAHTHDCLKELWGRSLIHKTRFKKGVKIQLDLDGIYKESVRTVEKACAGHERFLERTR